MLIIKIKKKSRRNLSLPYYKELKLGKLEYDRRKKKKKRITLEFCIYKALELRVLCCMELKVLKLEFHVAFFQ